jgi:hypothetical protein
MKRKASALTLISALIVILVSTPFANANLPAGAVQWEKTYGGSNSDYADSVIQTSDGGYAVTGYGYSFGPKSDGFLVKTDANGSAQWQQSFGGSGDDYGRCVVEAADGGFAVTGSTTSFGGSWSDVYLAKFDFGGVLQWQRTYAGVGDAQGYCLVRTGDGGFVIAGSSAFGSDSGDIMLIKTDANGNVLWNKTYGGTREDDGFSLIQTTDGGFAVAGQTFSFGHYDFDVYLVKTDSTGNMQWNKTYGGSKYEQGFSIIQNSDRGYTIAGNTNSFGNGSYDFYLVRTDMNGTLLWNQTYGGANDDFGRAVVQAADGGYAVAGITKSFGAGLDDIFFVRTDEKGNLESQKTYGTYGYEDAYSMIKTNDGYYVIAGSTGYLSGSSDFYLIKTLGPEATPTPTLKPTTIPTQTPTLTPSPVPIPTPLVAIVPASTGNGSTIDLIVCGNVTYSQMENVTIATNQSATTTILSFTLTGESGTTAFSNITIPKTAVALATMPIIYVDGVPAQSQGYTQDGGNYYVWYTTHFSTHEISIVFSAPLPTPSSTSFESGGVFLGLGWTQIAIIALMGTVLAVAVIAAFKVLSSKKTTK